MDETPRQPDAGETRRARRPQQSPATMSDHRNVSRDGHFVHRHWGAADGRIPLRAAMAGIDDERSSHSRAHPLQRVEKGRIVVIHSRAKPPATATGQLSHAEMRPAPCVVLGACDMLFHAGQIATPRIPVGLPERCPTTKSPLQAVITGSGRSPPPLLICCIYGTCRLCLICEISSAKAAPAQPCTGDPAGRCSRPPFRQT